MAEDITGIVLAGGHSTRMGRDKAQVGLQGKTLLQRVLEALSAACTDLIVVTSAEGLQGHQNLAGRARLVADISPERGPLGGLQTGLQEARNDFALAVGCDSPFLQPDLLWLVGRAAVEKDAALPVIGGVPQTLLGAYSRNCLSVIDGLLAEGNPGLRHLLPLVEVAYLTESEVLAADPSLLSFFNVNSEADLQRAEQLMRGSAAP